MLLLGVVLEIVEGGDLLPIEVQGVVSFDHLVNAVHILYDKAGTRRIKGATSEGNHRLLVPDQVENGGIEVGLTSDVLGVSPDQFASRVEDDDGDAEGSY